eukprot:CAMPEP_0194352578 /NCGR_PEP_ID=MMETSP0174-20130528/1012_1 /TAXON_ID=216777 /ORGANISM="Proboscia alata, Strain PI-D3" /LENGTH=204 /DNA_ID=CAMNT_0039120739 /DNA_START=32 /DNA_END=646 /DNA_ORIENTATION=-
MTHALFSTFLALFSFLLLACPVPGVSGFIAGAKRCQFATRSHLQTRVLLSSAVDQVDPQRFDVTVEKPLGIILGENVENEAKGVFCLECEEGSAAFSAGVRPGDVIASVGETDATALAFEDVMSMLGDAESPVMLSLDRAVAIEEVKLDKPKAKMSPKRMPSAKKLAKASTSVNFWKDPLMIGSAAFTVLFPLGIYLASKSVGS